MSYLYPIGNAVYEYKNKELILHKKLENLRAVITDMDFKSEDLIIVTNNSGVQILHNGEFESLSPFNDFGLDIFSSIHITSNKQICAGSKDGIFHQSISGLKEYKTENGLITNDITCIESDDEGNLWFGTEASGFIQFTSSNIVSYNTSDGLTSNLIMAVNRIGSDLFVGTYNGGVSVVNDPSFDSSLGTGSDELRVWDIEEISDNRILFATESGLIVLDKNKNEFIDLSSGLNSRRLKCIFTDRDGRIWLGSNKGVNFIENDSLYRFDFPDSLRISKTRAISQDSEGKFLVCHKTRACELPGW